MLPRSVEDRLRAWSPEFSPRLFRIILWVIAGSAIVLPLAMVALPYIEFFNDMAAQPKAKTQGTYGRLYGESIPTFREPPEHSIPRNYVPPRFVGNDDAVAVAAGETLSNPHKPTMESLRRGQVIFDRICITCHGKLGKGDGPVVGPDRYPAPTSLHDATVVGYPDGRIYHVISEGKGKMKGYKDKIERLDRWDVVNYVRALQRAVNPKPEDLNR